MPASQDNLQWFDEQCGFGKPSHDAQSSKDKCSGLTSAMHSILRGTRSVNTALRYINDAKTEKMPRLLEN